MRKIDTTASESPLPKPRLILRLGGLGNRRFGRESGTRIDEDTLALQQQAAGACDAVVAEIETILAEIHRDEMAMLQPAQSPKCSRLVSHGFALVFGAINRWKRKRGGEPGGVFSDEVPEVQVLTGGEPGGDTIIENAALGRPAGNGGAVEWRAQRIATAAPATLNADAGLGVGEAAAKDEELKQRAEADQGLGRADAAALSRITRQRARAYRAQSESLRHHSDLLLAVWDPDAEGKAGGTSESVELALRERIPVITVRVRGTGAPEIHVLVSVDQLYAFHGATSAMPKAGWEEELSRVLRGILSFPDSSATAAAPSGRAEEDSTAFHPRAAFAALVANKPFKTIWPGRLWQAFDALAKYRALRHAARHPPAGADPQELAKQATDAWKQFRKKASPWVLFSRQPEGASHQPPEAFAKHYGFAKDRVDSRGMSGVYGDAHRGGIVASYLFAALAVMFAVAAAILHFQHAPGWVQVGVALGETVVIFVMFALSACAKAEGWNLAYTHSRILAEALRQMEYLGPMGLHTPIPRLPRYLSGDARTRPPEELWAIWYFRALVRMAPLRLDDPTADTPTNMRTRVKGMIDRQIEYHSRNAEKQGTLLQDIERSSTWVFLGVFVTAMAHLIAGARGYHWDWLSMLCLVTCVGGPALIAAMHGCAAQIETARLRLRSASMVKLLRVQQRRLADLDLDRDPDSAETVWGLATETLAAASLMMDEAAGWSMLYTNTDIHAG